MDLEEDVATARPLFEAMADTIHYMGPIGAGIRTKLVNNYMSMVGMLLVAEALTLAAKCDLDRNRVVQVLSGTTAGRGQLNVNYPKKVLAGDITPDFPLRMGLKDISLALELGAEMGAPSRSARPHGNISRWRAPGDARTRTARPCCCYWRT